MDQARRNAFADDALIFGSEFASFADGSDPSADERIKSYLDPALMASRRRGVRRPLGAGGYQAQSIVFSDRDRDASPSMASGEPLSELLQQLAASRQSLRDGGSAASRAARVGGPGGASSASVLSSLGLDGPERGRKEGAGAASQIEQIRGYFVQELMLSALASDLDGEFAPETSLADRFPMPKEPAPSCSSITEFLAMRKAAEACNATEEPPAATTEGEADAQQQQQSTGSEDTKMDMEA